MIGGHTFYDFSFLKFTKIYFMDGNVVHLGDHIIFPEKGWSTVVGRSVRQRSVRWNPLMVFLLIFSLVVLLFKKRVLQSSTVSVELSMPLHLYQLLFRVF